VSEAGGPLLLVLDGNSLLHRAYHAAAPDLLRAAGVCAVQASDHEADDASGCWPRSAPWMPRGRSWTAVTAGPSRPSWGDSACQQLGRPAAREVVDRNRRLIRMRTDLPVPHPDTARLPLDLPAMRQALRRCGSQPVPLQPSPRLVFWDIDKTLVDIGGISREIYAAAFEVVTGLVLERMPDMAGKTDRDLIISSLQLRDVPEPERRLTDFYSALADATEARKAEIKERGRCLPGARAAVKQLTVVPRLVQSVVTGNIRPTAQIKLAAFDLADPIDFDIGGYGSDDGERATLVRLALQRARQKYGVAYLPENIFVIGDTPYDIAGAKANGVRAIGVASGSSMVGELEAAGADAVLVSLEDTDILLQLLLG
jgi:phosphoglycolate phosphatase